MAIFHLGCHRLVDDAFARRKIAAPISLQTMKTPSLRDFASVDAALHRGAEACEQFRSTKWLSNVIVRARIQRRYFFLHIITHRQHDLTRSTAEGRLEVPRTAVLGRILQGFLQNTEQTNGDLFRQICRDVLGVKINLHSLLVGEFSAKASSCHRQP